MIQLSTPTKSRRMSKAENLHDGVCPDPSHASTMAIQLRESGPNQSGNSNIRQPVDRRITKGPRSISNW